MPSDIYASKQGEYRAGNIAVTVIAAVFVGLRFAARWKKGLSVGIDDWAILISLMFLFSDAAIHLTMVHYGMGLHAQTQSAHNLVMIAKLLMTFECTYSVTIGLIKIAILLLYSRLFPTRAFRIAVYILGGIAIAWSIAIVCVSIFQCTPIARTWDSSIPGTCINLKGMFIGNAVPNIITDIAILSLPVRVVWKLQAPLANRLSVIGLFMLGSFVVFCSIYRFTTLFEFDATNTSGTIGSSCTWSVIECAIGIVSACMPTLRPLVMMVSSKFASRDGYGSRRNPTTKNSKGTNKGTGASGSRQRTPNSPSFRPTDEILAKNDVHMDVSQSGLDDYGDEVPLHSIRVRRDVTWEESGGNELPQHWK
ncbi:hypothetical protein BDW74DRAFT_160449 [Aspergillus multicolor]|uniref:uncharacterized protein n=1 Tax=Aspergillus multicolor TaxID=41759 RepID=UPI003CCD5534